MSTDRQMTVPQVADMLGIKPGTWRAYVTREQAPAADGQHDGRTPWWYESTVRAWRVRRAHDKEAPTHQ